MENLTKKEAELLQQAIRLHFDSYMVGMHELIAISEKLGLSKHFIREMESDLEMDTNI